MVGEMYDEVWAYINHIPKIYETYDSNTKGYSNDLIQDVPEIISLVNKSLKTLEIKRR